MIEKNINKYQIHEEVYVVEMFEEIYPANTINMSVVDWRETYTFLGFLLNLY